MKPESIHHDKPPLGPAASRLKKLDELLDEALEETFPASDPVSLSQPWTGPTDRRGD